MSATEIFHWGSQIVLLLAIVLITVYSIWKRKGSGAYLCGDCRFNDPQSCLKKERPYAVDCTSYRPVADLPGDRTKAI
jgi:hypothetical protein